MAVAESADFLATCSEHKRARPVCAEGEQLGERVCRQEGRMMVKTEEKDEIMGPSWGPQKRRRARGTTYFTHVSRSSIGWSLKKPYLTFFHALFSRIGKKQ